MLDFVSEKDLDVFIQKDNKIYISPKYIRLIENIVNDKKLMKEIYEGYKKMKNKKMRFKKEKYNKKTTKRSTS